MIEANMIFSKYNNLKYMNVIIIIIYYYNLCYLYYYLNMPNIAQICFILILLNILIELFNSNFQTLKNNLNEPGST